jgi:hypothetical protein
MNLLVIVYFDNDERSLRVVKSNDENLENKLIHYQSY